jgi:hypothetical protein
VGPRERSSPTSPPPTRPPELCPSTAGRSWPWGRWRAPSYDCSNVVPIYFRTRCSALAQAPVSASQRVGACLHWLGTVGLPTATLIKRNDQVPTRASDVITEGVPTGEVLIAPEPLIGLTAENCPKRRIWAAIRQQVLVDAESRCGDCCAATSDRRNLHAHEVWVYDDDRQIAVLSGIRCVCAACHAAIHAPPVAGPSSGGFAAWRAYGEEHAWAMRLVETRERRSCVGWTIAVNSTLARRWPELAALDGLVTLPGMGRTTSMHEARIWSATTGLRVRRGAYAREGHTATRSRRRVGPGREPHPGFALGPAWIPGPLEPLSGTQGRTDHSQLWRRALTDRPHNARMARNRRSRAGAQLGAPAIAPTPTGCNALPPTAGLHHLRLGSNPPTSRV